LLYLFLTPQVCKTTMGVQEDKETYTQVLFHEKKSKPKHVLHSRPATQLQHHPQPQRSLHCYTDLVLMYMLVGFVLALFALAMNPVVTEKEFTNACAAFQFFDESNRKVDMFNVDMFNICKKKTEITKPISKSCILFVWFIVIGIDFVFRFVDLTCIFSDLFVYMLTKREFTVTYL